MEGLSRCNLRRRVFPPPKSKNNGKWKGLTPRGGEGYKIKAREGGTIEEQLVPQF
jgi:hypothetical protein